MPLSDSEFGNLTATRRHIRILPFNPMLSVVLRIDSYTSLLQALELPDLRRVIQKLYPERIPRRPGPIPDPPIDSNLLVIPTGVSTETPDWVFRSQTRGSISSRPKLHGKGCQETRGGGGGRTEGHRASRGARVARRRPPVLPLWIAAICLPSPGLGQIEILSNLSRCRGPGLLLGFQEYDRTTLEKLGNPYTGTGPRQNLGSGGDGRTGKTTSSDSASRMLTLRRRHRMSLRVRSVAVQLFPDVIVQALGTGFSVDYEAPPTTTFRTCTASICACLRHLSPVARVLGRSGDPALW